MMTLRKIIVSALVLQLLAACGDRASDEAVVSSDDRKVPSSALSSATAFSQWVGTLNNTEGDTALSLDEQLKPPTTETEPPIGI